MATSEKASPSSSTKPRASYDAFPSALKLGYRGISSKACKGIYKSLLNGARAGHWNVTDRRETFVAAEDLTCQAGLAIQQDTALVAFHGIVHAERNGHHYVDGFCQSSPAEARAFLRAHPDLYEQGKGRCGSPCAKARSDWFARHPPGFASGVDPRQVGQKATEIQSETLKDYGT